MELPYFSGHAVTLKLGTTYKRMGITNVAKNAVMKTLAADTKKCGKIPFMSCVTNKGRLGKGESSLHFNHTNVIAAELLVDDRRILL